MAQTIKSAYAAAVAVFGTNDLDGLASDTNFLAGRESPTFDNNTDKYVDVMLSGRFKANASAPTVGQIQVYVGATLNEVPTYPDVFDGTGSAETITSVGIRNSILRMAAAIATDVTANRIYEFAPISVASLFGGAVPHQWFVFVTHSMVTALNATAGAGGQCWYTGVNYTVG